VAPIALDANARGQSLHAAFRAHVSPLVGTAVADERQRTAIEDSLLSSSIAGGFLVESYARLAGHGPHPQLAVLAGAFTRLYDDLLDEFDDSTIADRITELFAGQSFAARTDHERVLEAIFRSLTALAPRESHGLSYRTLATLHYYQVRSLRQTSSELRIAEIWELTLAKGGWAMVVLASLVQPNMPSEEEAILYRLGGFLQLIDDYRDEAQDRQRGLHTPSTRGDLSYRHLTARLNAVADSLHGYYGSRASTFVDGLYIWLDIVWLSRTFHKYWTRPPSSRTRPRRPSVRNLVLRREVIR
jgi:hypothetical protein